MNHYKVYEQRDSIDNNCSITSDVNELKRRLESFTAYGETTISYCINCHENIHHGMEYGLNRMEKKPTKITVILC